VPRRPAGWGPTPPAAAAAAIALNDNGTKWTSSAAAAAAQMKYGSASWQFLRTEREP